jgi:predicted outer membrane protein
MCKTFDAAYAKDMTKRHKDAIDFFEKDLDEAQKILISLNLRRAPYLHGLTIWKWRSI